jgi:hypothetical protein
MIYNLQLLCVIITGQKPLVECSFITEFEDHIFVTVDAEAFFFLHDLITSYVKERERVVCIVLITYLSVHGYGLSLYLLIVFKTVRLC